MYSIILFELYEFVETQRPNKARLELLDKKKNVAEEITTTVPVLLIVEHDASVQPWAEKEIH